MLKFSFVFFSVYFTIVSLSFSQNRNPDYIILNSGDTINNIKIVEKHKQTNKKQLTYRNNNSEQKSLLANTVVKYYDGKSVYLAEFQEEISSTVFINYFADGYYKAGMSYTKKGELEFFVNNSKELISLKEHKDELAIILSSSFENFNQFYEIYSKEITYDYKSLGDFISAYNAFLYPKLYRKEEYKNKQSFNLGFSLFPYNYNASFFNSDIDLSGFQVFRANINLENKLSPYFSTIFSPTVSLNKYRSDWMTFDYFSYKLEGHVQYLLRSSKKINILLSPGISFGYNYKLNTNYDPESSSMKVIYISPFSSDYLFDLVFDFKNHIKLVSGFQFSNVNTIEQGILSEAIYTKGRMQGIRIGLIYNFKKY